MIHNALLVRCRTHYESVSTLTYVHLRINRCSLHSSPPGTSTRDPSGSFFFPLKYRLCLETLPYEITRDPSTLQEYMVAGRLNKKECPVTLQPTSERPRHATDRRHAACNTTESLSQNVGTHTSPSLTRSTPYSRRRHPAPASTAATHAITHDAVHTQPIFAPHLEL